MDVEDSTPPSPPIWIQKSLPEEWPERGIDAHESGGIILEWEENPSADNVVMYHLYRSKDSPGDSEIESFQLIYTQYRSQALPPEYIDRNTELNTVYRYYLNSENDSENAGMNSDTIKYARFEAINSATMIPNGLNVMLQPNRQLRWHANYAVQVENFTLTIIGDENRLILRKVIYPGNYEGGVEYYYIPENISLVEGKSYSWRIDMGAQIENESETMGSESEWATFSM